MNILLTGSGGFIGCNFKNYFIGKHKLFSPRSKELDLTDNKAVMAFFKNNNIDLIIHAASEGVRIKSSDTYIVTENNLKMFRNLAMFMPPTARMISFGSGAEYDKNRNLHKVKEIDFGSFVPEEPYAYSKYLIAKDIDNHENIINLRLFGIYGKYENPSRFISYAIAQNLRKKPIIINKNVVFDYLFIDDLLRTTDYFIKNIPLSRAYNITPTENVDLIKLAEIVNSVSKFKSDIIVINDGLNYEYTGDNTRLLSEIGGFEFTSYYDGIQSLYTFLEEQYENN